MRKILFTALAIGIMGLVPMTAEAVCSVNGYVDKVSAKPSTAVSNVFVRRNSLGGTLWKGSTSDTRVVSAALDAVTNRAYVKIEGNATGCPTTGTIRIIGTINKLILAP